LKVRNPSEKKHNVSPTCATSSISHLRDSRILAVSFDHPPGTLFERERYLKYWCSKTCVPAAVPHYCADLIDFHRISRAEGPTQLTWM
jgi:hypothetical protein